MTEKINWDEVTLEPMDGEPVNQTETSEETSKQMENVAGEESGEPVVDTAESAEEARLAAETATAEQAEVEKLTAELHGLLDASRADYDRGQQILSNSIKSSTSKWTDRSNSTVAGLMHENAIREDTRRTLGTNDIPREMMTREEKRIEALKLKLGL